MKEGDNKAMAGFSDLETAKRASRLAAEVSEVLGSAKITINPSGGETQFVVSAGINSGQPILEASDTIFDASLARTTGSLRRQQKVGKPHDLTGFNGFYKGTFYRDGQAAGKPRR